MRRFKRFRRPFRRRARWDMQTFRECERQVDIPIKTPVIGTCAAPMTFLDYVCGLGTSTGLQMKGGASRTLTFGGGHLETRLSMGVIDSTLMPCSFDLKVILALLVLPVQEDEITPEYSPNVAIARSQLSVVPQTQSDTDENILWWRSYQLVASNFECNTTVPDTATCVPGTGCDTSNPPTIGTLLMANLGVAYGRWDHFELIRSRRRLREREALYLLMHYVWNQDFTQGDNQPQINWPVRRNVYFRYAVR